MCRGEIKAVIYRPIEGMVIEGKVKTVTVKKTVVMNTWLLCCLKMVKKNHNYNVEGNKIGFDLGLTHVYITCKGNKSDNPRYIKKYDKN